MFVTERYPSLPVIRLAGIIIEHYSYLRNAVVEQKRDIQSFEEISRKEIWREFINTPEYNDFNLSKLTVGELSMLGFSQVTDSNSKYDLWLFPTYFYDMIPFGTKTYNFLDTSWDSESNRGKIWGIDDFEPIILNNRGNLNIGIRRKKDSDYIFRIDVPTVKTGNGGNGSTARTPIETK